MEFKTNYAVGDKVWINAVNLVTGKEEAVQVEIFYIRILNRNSIDYCFSANHYAKFRQECHCYKSKEEALANRERERKEVDKDGAE